MKEKNGFFAKTENKVEIFTRLLGKPEIQKKRLVPKTVGPKR